MFALTTGAPPRQWRRFGSARGFGTRSCTQPRAALLSYRRVGASRAEGFPTAMLQPSEREAALEELCRDDFAFHGWSESIEIDWHLNTDVVRFIHSIVDEGARTLETGCGYSTIAFALAG